jgi:hypothetical protein
MELCAVFATIRCTLPGYLKIPASDRSDQPFAEAVLPRRAWGDGLVTDAQGVPTANPKWLTRDRDSVDTAPHE